MNHPLRLRFTTINTLKAPQPTRLWGALRLFVQGGQREKSKRTTPLARRAVESTTAYRHDYAIHQQGSGQTVWWVVAQFGWLVFSRFVRRCAVTSPLNRLAIVAYVGGFYPP